MVQMWFAIWHVLLWLSNYQYYPYPSVKTKQKIGKAYKHIYFVEHTLYMFWRSGAYIKNFRIIIYQNIHMFCYLVLSVFQIWVIMTFWLVLLCLVKKCFRCFPNFYCAEHCKLFQILVNEMCYPFPHLNDVYVYIPCMHGLYFKWYLYSYLSKYQFANTGGVIRLGITLWKRKEQGHIWI